MAACAGLKPSRDTTCHSKLNLSLCNDSVKSHSNIVNRKYKPFFCSRLSGMNYLMRVVIKISTSAN